MTQEPTTLLLSSASLSDAPEVNTTTGIPSLLHPPLVDDSACVLYDFITEGVLMGALCLFGFVGNSLSMLCLAKDRSKTATPFLLISLEAADSFFLFTVLILRVLTSLSDRQEGFLYDSVPYLAKYMFPVALIAMTSTIYMTLLVTLNRYICVCKPYKVHDLCSVRHAL